MPQPHHLQRRQFLQGSGVALGMGLLAACSQPQSNRSAERDRHLDQVKLGLNWRAEAEYGGFYQAVATGIYPEFGLEVEIQPLPPQGNSTQLLMGGLTDFTIGQAVGALKAIENGIPKVTVASIFQKEVQVLLAHPNVGNDSLAQLKGKTVFITPETSLIYWPLLEKKYGYTKDQQRTYSYNIAPFILDKNSAQQGVSTSEPYIIQKQGGFDPVVLPLTETGLNPYNFTIETTQKLVDTNPDLVQRFVDASIRGWYQYLQNPEPGNALIKQATPNMTDELMAFTYEKIKEYEMIIGGDATTLGIGAMSDDRWSQLYEPLVEIGVLQTNENYRDAYTLEFVNKGVEYYTSGISPHPSA
jgi:NitT/TauT family transport system substrate-binding protein